MGIQGDDGENGSQLNRHLEACRLVADEAEKMTGQYQMTGGGDWNEFRDPLHESQYDRNL